MRRKIERKQRMRKLDEYDTRGYVRDLEYLGRLSFLKEGTLAWIEARMYELRERANYFEHCLGEMLIKHGVDFIHQAPFVFRPKTIYFGDFYIPEKRVLIEVDGIYHKSSYMLAKDSERDANFRSVGIKVIRIANEETRDAERLWLRLSCLL